MKCKGCGVTVPKDWMTFCSDCYKDVRTATTPWYDSKHPAMNVPEPEHVERCAPELAAPYIAKCHELMAVEPEPDAPEPQSMLTCEHEFLHSHYGANQCSICSIYEHQFLYSIQVKPSAGVYEEGRR